LKETAIGILNCLHNVQYDAGFLKVIFRVLVSVELGFNQSTQALLITNVILVWTTMMYQYIIRLGVKNNARPSFLLNICFICFLLYLPPVLDVLLMQKLPPPIVFCATKQVMTDDTECHQCLLHFQVRTFRQNDCRVQLEDDKQ
jgi:hypothetical protein